MSPFLRNASAMLKHCILFTGDSSTTGGEEASSRQGAVAAAEPPSLITPPKKKANPFGDAKPVDTSARLLAFETKLRVCPFLKLLNPFAQPSYGSQSVSAWRAKNLENE